MSDVKKALLDFQTQEKLWTLLQNDDEVIMEVLGAEVKLSKLPATSNDQYEVIKEIESDPELRKMLHDSEVDEQEGRVYTADEAIKFMKEYGTE